MSNAIWTPNQDITPAQVKTAQESGDKPFLLDVRDTTERAIAVLDDDAHIPLPELANRVSELNPQTEIVVYCRTGNRSGVAAAELRRNGFTNVHNLTGGINAWAEQVAPLY